MRPASSHRGKRMKDRSLNTRPPMTKQELRKLKTMMQTKEVKGEKKKVRVQQRTTREMQLTVVSGSVTFVTSAAGLEVIFAVQMNVSNSSKTIRSFSSKGQNRMTCSLQSLALSKVSVRAHAVLLAATPRFPKTA